MKTEKDKLRKIWTSIKQRCLNPNDRRFERYGGRGIKIHSEWIDSFESFLDYVGFRPSENHSIDRINNNGNYEPGNVRWATPEEQVRNRENTLNYTYMGKERPLAELAETFDIPYPALYKRVVVRDWPIDKAIETPLKVKEERCYEYRGKMRTLADICQLEGKTYRTVHARVCKGMSLEDALDYKTVNPNMYFFKGIERTLTEIAKMLNVPETTLRNRIKRGRSFAEAINMPFKNKQENNHDIKRE